MLLAQSRLGGNQTSAQSRALGVRVVKISSTGNGVGPHPCELSAVRPTYKCKTVARVLCNFLKVTVNKTARIHTHVGVLSDPHPRDLNSALGSILLSYSWKLDARNWNIS